MMRGAMLAMMVLCAGVSHAAERDPTSPPPEAVTGPGLPGTQGSGGSAALQGSSVIVQNGRPFLVVGTRLYAVGQQVGNARLERITETEIWLREDRQLTKLPRFGGIQRTAAQPAVACSPKPAVSAPRSKRPAPKSLPSGTPQAVTPAAPCEGAQP